MKKEETVPDITHAKTPLPEATQGSINTQLDPALYASLSNSTERNENELESEEREEEKGEKEETVPDITFNQTPLPEVTQEPINTQLDPALYASLSNSTEISENNVENERKEEIYRNISPSQTPLPETTQESSSIQLDPTLYASLSNNTERGENELENEEKDEEKGEKEETVPDITHTQTPLPEVTQEPIIFQLDPTFYASLSNNTERSENKLGNEEKGKREETVPDIIHTKTLLPEATQESINTQLDPTLYASLSNSTERSENKLGNEGKGEKEEMVPNITPAQTPTPETTQEPKLDPTLYASLNKTTPSSENELENNEREEEKDEREETVSDITPAQPPLPEATQESINTQLDPALYASLGRNTEKNEAEAVLISAPAPWSVPGMGDNLAVQVRYRLGSRNY